MKEEKSNRKPPVINWHFLICQIEDFIAGGKKSRWDEL
jgi:hypothetical protein